MNLDAFASAALERRAFPIDAAGILHTVAALEAVFRSTEANGAWQCVGRRCSRSTALAPAQN